MPLFSEKETRYFRNFLISLQLQLEAEETDLTNEAELEKVALALEKLDRGTFGDCESCGIEIAYGRLRNSPENPLCPECAPAETVMIEMEPSGLEIEPLDEPNKPS